ncbi:hypothetical protein T484DRAFT_1781014 [Baffinella frigidus]|nr:hypothetical protein T484DRAFT_1781014 [Cryptophyta sp. CCMP2293]
MAPKWAWTEVVVQEGCDVEGVRSLVPPARPHTNHRVHPSNALADVPHRPATVSNGVRAAHGDGSYMYASEAARGHVSRQSTEREGQGMHASHEVRPFRADLSANSVSNTGGGGRDVDKHIVIMEGGDKTFLDHPPAVKQQTISPGARLAHPHDKAAWGPELEVPERISRVRSVTSSSESMTRKKHVHLAATEAIGSQLNWVGPRSTKKSPNYSWKRDRAEAIRRL